MKLAPLKNEEAHTTISRSTPLIEIGVILLLLGSSITLTARLICPIRFALAGSPQRYEPRVAILANRVMNQGSNLSDRFDKSVETKKCKYKTHPCGLPSQLTRLPRLLRPRSYDRA